MRIHFLFGNTVLATHKPVNFLIRWLDKSFAGHFAIGLETDFSFNVYEAVAPKVRKVTYSDWFKYYKPSQIYRIDIPANKELAVFEWLESLVGIRYGYEQVFMIGVFSILFPLKMIFKRINLNYTKALICTELGSRFVEKFIAYQLKKSHDEIGVRDMESIVNDLSLVEIKWKQM